MIVTFARLASARSESHDSHVARRETLNISYDLGRHGDLKAALDRLSQVQGSKWDGRKRADAAGHLLADAIKRELEELSISYDLTQSSQVEINGDPPVTMKRGAAS